MVILDCSLKNAGRVRAVYLEPKPSGLTVVGGRNRQGKTTCLDMIAWLVGGDKYRPPDPNHRGGDGPAELDMHTSNGLHIQRRGKNGSLYVKDETTGKDGNQTLLDKLLTPFALDLPSFRRAKSKEKCDILLRTLGVDVELTACQKAIDEAYEARKLVNRDAHQKEGALAQARKPDELPMDEPINVDELVASLQKANDKNAARQKLARDQDLLIESIDRDNEEIERLIRRVEELRLGIEAKKATLAKLPEPGEPVDTSRLQADIAKANELNAQFAKVTQQRRDYERVAREAADARRSSQAADAAVEVARKAKMELLASVQMPDPDIGVSDEGELTYKGDPWDALAGSDELIVSCKIVSKLNPECRFALVDELEKLDLESLAEFDKWADAEGLQVIGTRVSVGDECSLVIENGEVAAA